jgi:Flp pilus assembly protein TadD
MEDYNTAADLSPKDPDIYHNRGVLKFTLGDKVGAITDYDAAIKLDPKNADIYNNR